jgi:pimeloyl-ACP methyl ester carboxylesterase
MASDSSTGPVARRWLATLEPFRASIEFASLGASMGPLMLAPRGDGHRVLVLPGLGGGDGSTAPLRHYLDWLGYTTLPWELGTNRGITRMWPLLTERIHAILDPLDRSESLSLVGWSLGGTLALGLSFALPRRIRRVITLGSPQVPASGMAAPWVRAGYRMMNATRVGFSDLLDDWPLPRRSPPHTAIYSKTDAVVPWTLAMGGDDVAERIEVLGSHLGLGVNPAVLYAVADRLAAKDNTPFRPPLLLTALYPPIPAPGRPPGTS